MQRFHETYQENTVELDRILRVKENFDVLKKVLKIVKD